MGPIRNPRWEQKRTEGYVIVSSVWRILCLKIPWMGFVKQFREKTLNLI
jgi:hypothetical protein